MMSLTKATLRDMTDLKHDIRYHGEIINRLTKEVNRIIPRLKYNEDFLSDVRRGMLLFNSFVLNYILS